MPTLKPGMGVRIGTRMVILKNEYQTSQISLRINCQELPKRYDKQFLITSEFHPILGF